MIESPELSALNEAELRALAARLLDEVRFKQTAIDKLTHEMAVLKRLKFAARSEVFGGEQQSLLEEAIEADLEAVAQELEQLSRTTPSEAPTTQPKRAPLPPQLPRREIRHEPASTVCSCGCELKRIGEDIAEKLDYTPGLFTVERHIRGKWVCKRCETDMTPLPVGAEGEICVRGPSMLLGYGDPQATADSFDADGFFATGDLGRLTADGAVVVTGRKKDLINRGGEKVSAKEVEDILHRMPAVREAAVVAMPHARLGETLCAYLIAHGAAAPGLDDVLAFVAAAGVARQKYPERVVVVDDFPRTASGKIRKDRLRAKIRERLQAEAGASGALTV